MFSLGLSRRGGQQLHSLDPRPPPQRSRAVARLACTVLPGLRPLSSGPLLTRAPAPPQPCRRPPSEDPASRVAARSGVGEAAPDRMAGTWDVETSTSASSSLASSTSCVRAVQGWSWVFFFFFSLDSSFFFKDGILTRIALYMLGTGWKDFGIAVGGGGGDTDNQTDVLFPDLFLFSKTDKRHSGACPLPGGVTHGLPHLTTLHRNLCVFP